MSGSAHSSSLVNLIQQVFGHPEFRAHQREVCEAAAAGQDVLLVMPTGAGKSLCYQLPALARRAAGERGTALVISPLIALMDDQAAQLAALGLRVERIHSGLDRETARAACREYLSGELDFLFIAPERLRVAGFPEMLGKRKPALIAVDEAHCISQWGHDFRPDYRTLGQHLEALRPSPIIALTATATTAVQRDIVRQLRLREPAVFITGFRRSNLAVEVVELSKPQRAEFTESLLSDASARPAIVYAPSRKAAEELAVRLNANFRSAAYHAGLEPATRERVQREFLAGKIEVVVATIAFGMGIDKADVRTVVHVALPGSVEAFYQEIGRAGRDGQQSRSILLYSFADRKTQEFLLERNYPAASDLERMLRLVGDEFSSPERLQRQLVLDQETLERTIEKLSTHGAVVTDAQGNVRRTAAPDGATVQWQDGYEAQVNARRRQIDAMMAFAEGATCRMTALVDHFGDRSDPVRSCGLCDICRPSDARGSAMRQPTAAEREQLRAILTAVAARSTSTGKLFTELAVTKERKHFDALLDGLARAALVAVTNDSFRAPDGRDVTYRKVSVTHEGRTPDEETLDTVWLRAPAESGTSKPVKMSRKGRSSGDPQGRQSKRRRRPALASSAVVVRPESRVAVSTQRPAAASQEVNLNAKQSAIDARLRVWRKEQAHAIGLPSFFIFSDTVLRDIVVAAPASLSELRMIRGLGPEKLDRFGPAVLELCRAQ